MCASPQPHQFRCCKTSKQTSSQVQLTSGGLGVHCQKQTGVPQLCANTLTGVASLPRPENKCCLAHILDVKKQNFKTNDETDSQVRLYNFLRHEHQSLAH